MRRRLRTGCGELGRWGWLGSPRNEGVGFAWGAGTVGRAWVPTQRGCRVCVGSRDGGAGLGPHATKVSGLRGECGRLGRPYSPRLMPVPVRTRGGLATRVAAFTAVS
jgi:hypothetical protein